LMGFILGVCGGQSMSSMSTSTAILGPHENHELRSALVGTGLLHGDKAVLQRATLH
jgi:hypothetical protein